MLSTSVGKLESIPANHVMVIFSSLMGRATSPGSASVPDISPLDSPPSDALLVEELPSVEALESFPPQPVNAEKASREANRRARNLARFITFTSIFWIVPARCTVCLVRGPVPAARRQTPRP